MYQGIAKVHKPNWFPEDKDRLEKVLLDLWPNSKINPRKMVYYIDSVKAFYPEIVDEAIGNIVRNQEYDRRPTISQLRKECQRLVRSKYQDRQGPKDDGDCKYCNRHPYVFVGLYIEPPEKCIALDISGKNVLQAKDGWIVRPDWGWELELNREEYMVHCPHCEPPHSLVGLRSARRWYEVYYHFTEFRCRQNGNTDNQWIVAHRLFHQMISNQPTGELSFDELRKAEARFHEYLAKLPDNSEFEERKMNVIGRNDRPENQPPPGDQQEAREEESLSTTQGEILPSQDEGLSQGSGLSGGDCRENPEGRDEGRQG